MAPKNYCTPEDIKLLLPDQEWGSSYENVLNVLCERASRGIDAYTKRADGAYVADVDSTQYFAGSGRISSELWIGELAALPTSVSVAMDGNLSSYEVWASSDYHVWPWNAITNGEPIRRLDIDRLYGTKVYWPHYAKSVKIVGKFGFSTKAPEQIVMATIIQATRWFHRGKQGFVDTGAVIDLGQLRYTRKLDPEVESLLVDGGYVRKVI